MKYALRSTLAAVVTTLATVAMASEPFTVEQLHESAKWATEDFAGANESESVYGFTVARGEEEGANVRVYYQDGQKYASYFCHVHHAATGHIDCHATD